MEENKKRAVFDVLSSINCNNHTEKKNDLTYLSWAWAWGIVKTYYPDAKYVVTAYDGGRLYLSDPTFGIMVHTEVTIEDQTLEMWLPVMDGANKAMKEIPYTYTAWDKYKKQQVEKTVEAATMFDINKAIMRCLAKNLAMFGLGHYIYAGEDLPTDVEDLKAENVWNEASPENLTIALKQIKEAKNLADLKEVVRDWGGAFGKDETFIAAGKQRQEELGIY